MPAAIPIAMIASTAIGGALQNHAGQQSTSTPTMAPEYGPLQNIVLQSITKRLSDQSSLPAGYETGGISGINHTYDLVKANLQNSLTARGLGGSPIAGAADTQLQTGRAGSIAGFRSNLPLVERDLRNQDLGMAAGILPLGRGQSTTGDFTNGGGAAGAFTNLAQYMGYLSGKGAFKGGGGSGNGLPGQMPMPGAFASPGAY